MNPQDDPEARIRELERPLSEMAKTSELGTGQYTGGWVAPTTPPTTPLGTYGVPYLAPTPRASTGFRGWWLVFALLVVGVAGVGGAVAVFHTVETTAGDFVNHSPGARPSAGGSFTTFPNAAPGPPRGKTAATPLPPPPAGGQLSVSGIGENKTIACNDSLVSVSGVANVIVITGHCASLSVSGVQNVVTLDAADAIGASGFDNRVTYRAGSPTIQNSGGNNVVQRG